MLVCTGPGLALLVAWALIVPRIERTIIFNRFADRVRDLGPAAARRPVARHPLLVEGGVPGIQDALRTDAGAELRQPPRRLDRGAGGAAARRAGDRLPLRLAADRAGVPGPPPGRGRGQGVPGGLRHRRHSHHHRHRVLADRRIAALLHLCLAGRFPVRPQLDAAADGVPRRPGRRRGGVRLRAAARRHAADHRRSRSPSPRRSAFCRRSTCPTTPPSRCAPSASRCWRCWPASPPWSTASSRR